MADDQKTISLEEITAREGALTTKVKTLAGFTLDEAFQMLDTRLPKEAYGDIKSGIGKKLGLTDIKPAYSNELMNRIFGLAGVGWGVTLDAAPEVTVGKTSGGGSNWFSRCSGTVWIAYTVDGKTIERAPLGISSTGGHLNAGAPEYAEKGSVTNLIGNALSIAGLQRSVYKNQRDERSVTNEEAAEARAGNGGGQSQGQGQGSNDSQSQGQGQASERVVTEKEKREINDLLEVAKTNGRLDELKAEVVKHASDGRFSYSAIKYDMSDQQRAKLLKIAREPQPAPAPEAPSTPPAFDDDDIPF